MSEPSSDVANARRRLLLGAGALAAAASVATPSLAQSSPTRTRAMRSNARRFIRRSATPPSPPLAALALNHMGFGPRPGDIAAFNALGANDTARLTAYVDQQLNPLAIVDSEVAARLSAAGFATLNKSRTQLWTDHHASGPVWSDRIRPIVETERATFIRAIYTKRQLFELMAAFWHNHFNVYAWEFWIAPQWVYYDRDVIRANALGNFRTLLEQVAQSTAMLYYLDNYTSTAGGPNENFARELFELHTLGAENYLGVMRQQDVPLDGQGNPIGYVDDDVFEATRCFTGWTYADGNNPDDLDDGSFYYRADWHDRFQKTVLGTFIPSNQGDLQDGMTVLDALAAHPGTGRHIARKLCQRLISDSPPETIVQAAAAEFTASWQAPDQIARTLRVILLSNEFRTTFGEKIKRPFEHTVSAMRAVDADFPFLVDTGQGGDDVNDSNGFFNRFDDAGQDLFSWRSPDGFPDLREDWESISPRVASWRLLNWLVTVEADGNSLRLDAVGQTPAGVRSANALADFWIDRLLGYPMDSAERAEIVEFMAQGRNPDFDLPLDADDDTQERLQAMVALIFMSPAFLWR
ncbi:MAG: DUF1800 domain-containing protein [Acidobacteriota bacterium]